MIKAALAYARFGYAVFPCCPRNKVPLIPKERGGNGCKDATTDTSTITEWWTEYPEASVGIHAEKSGLIFIDIDPRNGGDQTWAEIEKGVATTTVVTGSGGRHLWFQDPKVRWPKTLGPGVDVQWGNKYVIAPPSIHPNGRKYAFDPQLHIRSLKPQECPEWLLKYESAEPVSTRLAFSGNNGRQDELIAKLGLREKRGEWVGFCPVHEETKPSLGVNFEKAVFNCFGCGYSGTLSTLYWQQLEVAG